MAFYSYLSTKIIIAFITKSYQDLFGVRSYINAIIYIPLLYHLSLIHMEILLLLVIIQVEELLRNIWVMRVQIRMLNRKLNP